MLHLLPMICSSNQQPQSKYLAKNQFFVFYVLYLSICKYCFLQVLAVQFYFLYRPNKPLKLLQMLNMGYKQGLENVTQLLLQLHVLQELLTTHFCLLMTMLNILELRTLEQVFYNYLLLGLKIAVILLTCFNKPPIAYFAVSES